MACCDARSSDYARIGTSHPVGQMVLQHRPLRFLTTWGRCSSYDISVFNTNPVFDGEIRLK